jgi:hypothetical protein
MTELHTQEMATWAQNYKLLVARAGAEFIGVEDGSILFRADAESPVCSLYPYAIRSTQDISLALKSVAEAKKAAQWEFAEPVTKETNA